jgi:hypothetical protein
LAGVKTALFQATQSSNLTISPPKISRALPYVKSTLPCERRFTKSRSLTALAPPAYVVGIVDHFPRAIQFNWIQLDCCIGDPQNNGMKSKAENGWLTTLDESFVNAFAQALDISCMNQKLGTVFCQGVQGLFVHRHVSHRLPLVHGHDPLQLTSTTSLSLPMAFEMACNRSSANFAPGNRYEVTMTL